LAITKTNGILLLIALLCTACSTSEEIAQSPAVTKSNAISTLTPATSPDETKGPAKSYQTALANNLKVDATVDQPQAKVIPTLQVTEKGFSKNALIPTFFGSADVNEQKDASETRYSSGENTLRVPEGAGSFQYTTPTGTYIYSILNNMNSGPDTIFHSNELDFMTSADAVNLAAQTFKKLGITPHMPPKLYALDPVALQKEQDALMKDKDLKWFIDTGKIKFKEKWTKTDQFYYLVFRVDLQAVPCSPISYTLQNSEVEVPGSEVRVILSKDGIVSIQIVGTIYDEQSKKGDSRQLLAVEQALDRLKEKYDAIILKNELTVTDIALEYAPVIVSSKIDSKTGELTNKQTEMVPAWRFTISQKYAKAGEAFTSTTNVLLNAVTGKEIQ